MEKCPDLLNIVKEDGFSALHLASLNGHFAVVNALIEVRNDSDDFASFGAQFVPNNAKFNTF